MRFAAVRRLTSATTAAAVLGISAAACGGGGSGGGGVDHAKLVSTIKSEVAKQEGVSQADLKKLPASYFDCVANVLDKYVPSDQLKKLVDGKIKANEVKPSGKDKAKGSAALNKCQSDAQAKLRGK